MYVCFTSPIIYIFSFSSFTPTLHFSVSLCHGSHYRLTLLVGRRLMNFSFPAHGSTKEWWNPDSGACVGGHVSRWRWKHRFIEVGSANNYSSSSADRAALNSARLSMRKSEGFKMQSQVLSLGEIIWGPGLLAALLIDMNKSQLRYSRFYQNERHAYWKPVFACADFSWSLL